MKLIVAGVVVFAVLVLMYVFQSPMNELGGGGRASSNRAIIDPLFKSGSRQAIIDPLFKSGSHQAIIDPLF